ncbi:hypothetical protein QTQ03_22680 [Micromonospora sp. WMMA1363]|uniref:hypothetical protein n=1 Tax=Micromonospora sp. WMMA1363 TaxID=3053985 RepID=UPI00259D1D52|nr:hypothetical protein [Micromonospora sp. WMMA1363]MDM4722255.1 hypothetical protein [Micromonospora sp. WMMA1363]
MSIDWKVRAVNDRFVLDAHNTGKLTFTVSNTSMEEQRAIFDVEPGENAKRAWFTVENPNRPISGQGSATFLVDLAVPPGTPTGRYEMKGLAYSAQLAPEETSQSSQRVTFDVKRVPRTMPVPWWMIAAGAVLILITGAVVGYLRGRQDPAPTAPQTLIIEAESWSSTATVTSSLAGSPASVGEQFDACCGNVSWSGGAQLLFNGKAAGDKLTVSFNIPTDDLWQVSVVRTTAPSYGNTIYTLDGEQLGNLFFGYTANTIKTSWIDAGTVKLTAGEHTLSLVVVGRTQGTGFDAGIDVIRLTEVVPESTPAT